MIVSQVRSFLFHLFVIEDLRVVAANEHTLSILSCKVFYEYLCTSLLNFHLDQSLIEAALCLFEGAKSFAVGFCLHC